jgi:hypothetical protein
MAKFIYREGVTREPKGYTVTVTDAKGKQLYKRDFVTGIIRDFGNYIRTLIEGAVMFDQYEDGFTDFDMVQERNGHLLNIEFKGDFKKLLEGGSQLVTAVNLATTSKVTTFFVEGDSDNPKRIFTVSHLLQLNKPEIVELDGIDGLNEYIRLWRKQAEVAPPLRNRNRTEALRTQLLKQLGGK